ncbi:MAG: ABC transporter permease subunit [Kofleriaceae bacterium]
MTTQRPPLRLPRPLMVLTRIIPRRGTWIDVLVIGFVVVLLYGLYTVELQWRAPANSSFEIDLALSALPRYTFFSLCRGVAAFGLSFVFTLVYGYVAARVRGADRVMLPVLDILQSIPVLGFMPGVVLALAALFPHTNVGLELAAVVMIFTGQVWNMTFSFYHSLRAIPSDLIEAAEVYRFGWWRRFTRVELPFSTVGLVWNGMMSMAGGWFFLTINEAFRLGTHDFRLPGVGAYMSVAIDRNDRGAMIAAVLAMVIMILIVDQLFWRPLVAWSNKFKFEDIGAATVNESWVLELLRRTRFYVWWRERRARRALREAASPAAPLRPAPAASASPVGRWIGIVLLVGFSALCLWGGSKLARLLDQLGGDDWWRIGRASGYTLARTTIAVALGSLWAIPAGIYIGTNPRASRVLQPIVQVAASFPAPMLFPLVLLVLARIDVSLSIGSIVLMMLGTQWYILFNVIAGAMSIPNELQEAATVYKFTRVQRWRRVLLPGVFPSLVTGWVTAAGGAWNASIVSEYVHAGGKVLRTDGLGALISTAAETGRFALLAAGVLMMAVLVVLINRTFWKRLYDLAERKYALGR